MVIAQKVNNELPHWKLISSIKFDSFIKLNKTANISLAFSHFKSEVCEKLMQAFYSQLFFFISFLCCGFYFSKIMENFKKNNPLKACLAGKCSIILINANSCIASFRTCLSFRYCYYSHSLVSVVYKTINHWSKRYNVQKCHVKLPRKKRNGNTLIVDGGGGSASFRGVPVWRFFTKTYSLSCRHLYTVRIG